MKVLIEKSQIQERIQTLATEIDAYYLGREIHLVALLNGAIIFAADLVRQLKTPLKIDTLAVSSYQGLKSSGEIVFRCPTKLPVAGRHVLIVDDIFDSGLTLDKVADLLHQQGAASVECCCLLRKVIPGNELPSPRFLGFTIPDQYAIGYGLDAEEAYRNLPDIRVL